MKLCVIEPYVLAKKVSLNKAQNEPIIGFFEVIEKFGPLFSELGLQ